MGMFLNSSIPYEAYREVLMDKMAGWVKSQNIRDGF